MSTATPRNAKDDVDASPRDAFGLIKCAWEGWKRIAQVIGDFQARVLLTVFYFAVLGPFAIAVRVFGDPLAMKPATPRGWHGRPERDVTLADALRQF